MADESYQPKPFIYSSRGIGARWEPDRVPEEYYLQALNTFERSESSLSSRYGTLCLNRDPNAAPTPAHNWFFSTPVVALARLLYSAAATPSTPAPSWRYAATADGNLWRRAGTGQGPFLQIYSGLSGQPFQSLVTSCFETSQPYLFIADQAASIKDSPTTLTAPQLWGIDPPSYTINSLPYAPLLTLIDNFATANSYSSSGFSVGWAFASVTTIPGSSGQTVTDFPQFLASTTPFTVAGSNTTIAQAVPGTNTGTNTLAAFSSSVISAGETVSVAVTVAGFFGPSGMVGTGSDVFQYSLDNGITWTTFYTLAWSAQSPGYASQVTVPLSLVFSAAQLSNLNLLRFRAQGTLVFTSGGGILNLNFGINFLSATINAGGVFGSICNGILSNLNTNSSINVPITSVQSFDLLAGLYTELEVETSSSMGWTPGNGIGIYASSNPLDDGFYYIANTGAPQGFFLVPPALSPVFVNAIGGFVRGHATTGPASCILANLYSSPYPAQFSAWGFNQPVLNNTASFPIGSWGGTVATNATATVGVTANFDLSQNNAVNDSDLIVLTVQVGSPANIASIKLQFDVNGSGYTSSYYTATLSPAYYQGDLTNQLSAYQTTQNQILADTLGLLTGQPTGSTTAQLQPSNFSTGSGAWVAVLIPRGNFLPVGNAGQSGLDWGNITGWQVVVQTTATAITGSGSSTVALNGLYLQWGYGPSSFGGIGYDWRYTYYNANTGTESSPSPEQQFSSQFGYLSSLAAPFYLRQAAFLTGQYSADSQVTHLRFYRRGGIFASNWLLIDQVPNVTGGGQFSYKDVIPDASLAQATPLALDNDPPVTSTLAQPILTTLAAATTGPGQSYYSTFAPQVIQVAPLGNGAVPQFVPDQTVLVGDATTLEEVLVVAGGSGQFSAILRLQHNAGEQVSATSVPRQHPSICCLAYNNQTFVVDPLNPMNVFFSKEGYPENFGPQDYFPVGAPDDPVMALINWRGTVVAATLKTWKIVVGGGKPYAQPTGAAHGLIATQGWTLVNGAIMFRSADGWREFSGADGEYQTLPVEWMFRATPAAILPPRALLNSVATASDVFCFYQNQVYGSYISATSNALQPSSPNAGRYRLRYDLAYRRFGLDDVPATAMLWERDTNVLLVGRQISATSYAVVQDWVGDYDDGGWNGAGTSLVQTPISLTTQTPYRDLGRPHHPKQWNMLEGDYNTQGQPIQTTLFFNTEPPSSMVLPAANTGLQRSKVQYQIPPASATNSATGIQAYSMSVQHTMAVTVAPTLYQEDMYAVLLADYRTSYDTYWQTFSSNLLKLVKDGYFDYLATAQLIVLLYADGASNPYYIDQTTLIPVTLKKTVRVQFPALKCRQWRMVVTSTQPFQLWQPVSVEVKQLEEGSGYEKAPLKVSEG